MTTKTITLALLPVTAISLASCAVEPTPASPNHEKKELSQKMSPAAQRSQEIYELGYKLGKQDGSSGKSRTPTRHTNAYPPSESDAFTIGYEKGYNAGI